MSNFDLRKFLAEGKLYEEATSTEEAMDKPSTKMKMSELKKKIREEILSELTLNEDDEISVGGAETQADVDFYEGLEEATKDGDGEVPSKDKNTDIDIEDKEEVEVDVEKKPKMSTTDSEFLDQLEDLKDEADAMGDSKLERQIDNTITYFTRQHIAANESIELEEADDMALVADLEAALAEGDTEFQRVDRGDEDVTAKDKAEEEVYGAGVEKGEEIEKKKLQKESLEILKMKKLAGLLTEGEYAKALLKETEEVDEMATLIKKSSPLENEKPLQIDDLIMWTKLDYSNNRGMGPTGTRTLGKIVKILGPANVEAEEIKTGDLYKVSRKELTKVPSVGDEIEATLSYNYGAGSGSQGSDRVSGTIKKVDLKNMKVAIKTANSDKPLVVSLEDLKIK